MFNSIILNKEFIAQAVGIVAMVFNILSYQGKRQSTIIALQLVGGALFAVNFFMLNALTGAILNLIAVARAVIFLYKDKLRADRIEWLYGFVALYIAVYICNFTWFGLALTVRNFIVEILPVIGITALSVGFRLKNAADVRRLGLVSSPSWLIYNIFAHSYGAIICETLTLISIFLGILRHDKN